MNTTRSSGDGQDAYGGRYEPFDAPWEADMRRTMEPTGWDASLAIRAARDALLVIRGELSEEEFQQRYHDAYLKEFGVDLRPSAGDASVAMVEEPAGDSGLISLEEIPGGTMPAPEVVRKRLSRRAAVGITGGVIGSLLASELLSVSVGDARADSGQGGGHTGAAPAPTGGGGGPAAAAGKPAKRRMGMVMDLDKCDGCLMCVSTCKRDHGLPDGVHWIYVLAYKEPEQPDNTNFLVRTCQHCAEAPCVKVCPTGARHRRDDGIVLTDYDVCFGCRYCQVSCPYGVNYFGWDEAKVAGGGFTGERKDARGKKVDGAPPRGVMGKCVFDAVQQDSPYSRGSTHCSRACPMGVIHFGDLNDPESEPNQYLKRRIEASGGKLSTFRLLDDLGTKPNVIYIGNEPSRHAVPTEGPTRYEDWGMVQHRRIVLEGPEPWFKRMFGR